MTVRSDAGRVDTRLTGWWLFLAWLAWAVVTPCSYTTLTAPTGGLVETSVVAGSLKKKTQESCDGGERQDTKTLEKQKHTKT